MLGAIIGDTCGSVYEFNNLKDYNGIEFFKRGCRPTDDSIMTIAVAKALLDTYGKPKNVTRKALIDSMHEYTGDAYMYSIKKYWSPARLIILGSSKSINQFCSLNQPIN